MVAGWLFSSPFILYCKKYVSFCVDSFIYAYYIHVQIAVCYVHTHSCSFQCATFRFNTIGWLHMFVSSWFCVFVAYFHAIFFPNKIHTDPSRTICKLQKCDLTNNCDCEKSIHSLMIHLKCALVVDVFLQIEIDRFGSQLMSLIAIAYCF